MVTAFTTPSYEQLHRMIDNNFVVVLLLHCQINLFPCRLLPLYAGIILISIGYENNLSTGPFGGFFVKGIYEDNCSKNWWTNLLYINNVVNDKQMVSSCPVECKLFGLMQDILDIMKRTTACSI